MDNVKIARRVRIGVLAVILALVTYEAYMHQVLGGGKSPSVHALCPYGAIESLYAIIFAGSFIQKIYSGTFAILIITVIISVLFRRSFCGILCPFGALQEFFARVGGKVFKVRPTLPGSVDRPLRYLKFIVLPLTAFMAWYTGTLWMSPYDPYSAYGHISNMGGAIAEEPAAIVGFALLAATLIGSFVYDRFFCKYICPAGAFYGVIGKISPTKIERNDDTCVHCKACTKACPMNIDVEKAETITSIECINCNECVNACPKKGTLEIRTAGKKIRPMAILILVVAIFFGGILVAQAAGLYQVLPDRVKVSDGQTVSVSELKGYYTIEESAKYTGMEIDEFYERLGIPKSVPKETQMKKISEIVPEFDFDAIKQGLK